MYVHRSKSFYVLICVSLLRQNVSLAVFELIAQITTITALLWLTATLTIFSRDLPKRAPNTMLNKVLAFEMSRRIYRAILTRRQSAWVWGPLSFTRLMGRVDMEQASKNVSFSSHQQRFNARAERMLQGRRRVSLDRLHVLCIFFSNDFRNSSGIVQWRNFYVIIWLLFTGLLPIPIPYFSLSVHSLLIPNPAQARPRPLSHASHLPLETRPGQDWVKEQYKTEVEAGQSHPVN